MGSPPEPTADLNGPDRIARERLQSAIIDSAAYGIIATTPEGIITEFNRAAERMLGYAAAELVGRSTPELLHLPAEVAARAEQFGAELNEPLEPGFGVFVAKARRGLPNEHVWTYVRKDGGQFPALISITALRSDSGEICGYLGLASDISERQKSEQALRASEEKLRNLFALSPLGIALTDLEGRYLEFNESFQKICGYSAEELNALNYWDLTPKDYEAREAEQLRLLERTGRYGPYDKEYIRKDGQRVPLRLNGTLLTGADGKGYIWSIVEDVSEAVRARTALEEAKVSAEAANQAKSTFLANISHELRTPLNGVIALAGALAQSELTPRQRELVEVIVRSGESLERIVSEILDLSKAEAGRIELEPAPIDLAEEVRLAAEVMRGRAEDKGLGFSVFVAAEAEGTFMGDAGRIRQVVSNLVSNAVKFTEQGRVDIALTLEDDLPGSPGRVVIAVADTGIGVEEAVLPQLFERFTQADESITRRYGGTGLGLAICRELVQLMGGAISATSSPGRGSRFEVRLPLSRGDATISRPIEDAPAELGDCAAMRVLLAEDHPTNRRVIELLLEPLGVTLVTTVNGAEALEAFRSAPFDLVLMDMQMPVMDGLTATREIRAWERAAGRQQTPVVMLTANTQSQHREAAAEAGADAFLPKPVTPQALYAVLGGVELQAP